MRTCKCDDTCLVYAVAGSFSSFGKHGVVKPTFSCTAQSGMFPNHNPGLETLNLLLKSSCSPVSQKWQQVI